MNDSNLKGSMTRRDIVAGTLGLSVLTCGVGTVSAASGSSATGTWDLEADVVVIGTGALGLPAAIIAKEAGS